VSIIKILISERRRVKRGRDEGGAEFPEFVEQKEI
jgi:hypothetical protein